MSASEHKAAGDAAFGQQRFREAIEAYSQALACLAGAEDREMRGALLANRCLAWLQLGGDRPAAAAAASDDGASHHQQQRQALAQALLDAQQAVQLRPRWAKAHLRLAHAQAASGNTQAAAAAYSRAAVLDPALQPAVAKAQAALERDASRQRCLLVLQGHQGPIYDAAVREQGLALGSLLTPLVATAGADARVRLWCGRLLQELSGHGDRVARLAWSPCGSLLATASLDGSARLWRLDAAAVEAPGALEALACGRQQLPLLVPGPVLQLPQGSRATCLAFSPDSRLLAAGSSEGAVWLLETAGDGSQPRRLSGHGGSVTSVCFSPCGQLLASASGDGLCKLWGAPSGHAVAEIAAQSGPVTHCCFVALPASGVAAVSELARPPALLLTCHANPQRQGGRMLLWDAVQRRHGWVDGKLCGPVAAIDGFGGKVTSLHAWCCSKQEGSAEDGDAPQALLATACADGAVRLFDAAAVAAAQPALTAAAGSKAAAAATAPLWQVEPWSAAGGGWGDDVPAWRAVALQQAQHERSLVALSPDGRQLAVAGPDQGRIRILQADSGEQRLALVGHTAPLRALRWLGGTKLLSAGEDGSARVWCVGAA